MKTGLDGQTAVVIGGTTGIGRAIAEALAEEGVNVVPTSRTEAKVRDAAEAVECDIVRPIDVTERDQVTELFERVTAEIGGIDVLVNSAGVLQDVKPTAEITDREWDDIIETNLYGVFLASQLIPAYMGEGHKAILNISSVNGDIPVPQLSVYGASKFGVKGLTKNLALEYGEQGIRVNAIAPGYVKTRQNREALEADDLREVLHDRTPLSRYAKLDEVADAAVFLSSPAASFITGETLLIDGGLSLHF